MENKIFSIIIGSMEDPFDEDNRITTQDVFSPQLGNPLEIVLDEECEISTKLIGIYYKLQHLHIYPGIYKLNEDEELYLKNKFRVIVTEKTINNGYSLDSEQIKKHLEINKPYTLKIMKVDKFSSTIELEEFPGKLFNSVNFKFLKL